MGTESMDPGAMDTGAAHTGSLPYLDEHATVIAAPADVVWRVLGETFERSFSHLGASGYVRLVGAADRLAPGPRPLAPGSTLPGFHVVDAVVGRRLALEGRHRFSTYSLTFRLEPIDAGRTRLRAESRAVFPGLAGGIYRALVVGTGGHVIGMRRLLSTISRRCDRNRSGA
jgi:hypothetical protein